MPLKKASYARIAALDAGSAGAIAGRLKKISFGLNSDVHVVSASHSGSELAVELAVRREVEGQTFDSDKGRFVGEKRYDYRQLQFEIDTASALARTPGARRDLGPLVEQLRRCGASSAEVVDLRVDMLAWTEAFLRMYQTAQFGAMVVDDYFTEPRLIGRYAAKSVDNRLDLEFTRRHAGQLRSMRFAVFAEGVRRSVEVRRDMVLSVTSAEEEDLENFFEEQEKLLKSHSSVSDDDE